MTGRAAAGRRLAGICSICEAPLTTWDPRSRRWYWCRGCDAKPSNKPTRGRT